MSVINYYNHINQGFAARLLGVSEKAAKIMGMTPASAIGKPITFNGVINRHKQPAFPFSYGFVDQDINNLYKGDEQMGSLFNVFAIIAIFISCMGLYGLSAFMAEQRSKEIGVRKVLGASVFNVVYLLSTGFTKLILIAIVIAIPIAWFAINKWLSSFAYRVNIGWAIFLIASSGTLAIAWITVSYESVKAAIVNPVKSLRTD